MISGSSLIVFGLVLVALYFLIERAEGGPDDSVDPDRTPDSSQPGAIHVIPGE